MSEFRLKIEKIRSSLDFSAEQLYLIEPIDAKSGFLLGNNKIYFVIKNEGTESESISTTYLSLKTNIHINTIENYPTFEPGYYDLVIYDISTDEKYLDSFTELCRMYRISKTDISFVNFFYSLLKLFEPSREVSFSNLIGVFGELIFIKTFYEKYGIAIDSNWHNSFGSTDKYDFSFKKFNVEIKTTIKDDMRFAIKHNQIFNEKNNYIVVINVDTDNSGYSVSDLYDFFKATQPFSNNIEFMINLENEKQKVAKSDFYGKRFSLQKMNVFSNKQLVTLKDIPVCIDSIGYMYDFVGQETIDMSLLVENIRND